MEEHISNNECPKCKGKTELLNFVFGRQVCPKCKVVYITNGDHPNFDKWSSYGYLYDTYKVEAYGPIIEEIPILVPDGKKGEYEIKTFTIDEETAMHLNIEAELHGKERYTRAGTYKKLCKGNKALMSNVMAEIYDLHELWARAKGSVLITGLGLGLCLLNLLKNPNVKDITVVELEQDVIDLVAETYPFVRIVKGNAYEYVPEKVCQTIYHDLWWSIHPDNYPEMNKLFEHYKDYCDGWQGAWKFELCKKQFEIRETRDKK